MKVSTEFVFLDGAEAATTGAEMYNADGESLTIAVSGTFVGSMKFQGQLGGEWYDLEGIKTDDLGVYSGITAAGAYIVVGVEGMRKIRVNLTSLTSGSVTAIGRLTRTTE